MTLFKEEVENYFDGKVKAIEVVRGGTELYPL